MSSHRCRFCASPLSVTFADLGTSPLSNSYVEAEALDQGEIFFPLHAYLCTDCYLVQLPEVERPEKIFSDYAYFSSYSDSWLRHAEAYARMAAQRFSLTAESLVVEVASNDGYLLRFFAEQGIGVQGIEPAGNVAAAAEKVGVPTLVRFFGTQLATDLRAGSGPLAARGADLMVANNVLAHVPQLNDFVEGFRILLAADGVCTFEFPHLLRLIEGGEFDTIYHEHYSYFSLATVRKVFARHRLTLFDVEELPTHGGSLRIFCRHEADAGKPVEERVHQLLAREEEAGLGDPATYSGFVHRIERIKRDLLRFLLDAREEGKTVVGYGAPAKGNTLLNYCGIKADLLSYTVDRSPHKQGRYLPGTRIPIHSPDEIRRTRPDYLLILPWNLEAEIRRQMSDITSWGGRFVVAIPKLEINP